MSKIIKTTEDGWDCAPDLVSAASTVRDFGHLFYEINCWGKRAMSTEDMLTELRYFVQCLDENISQAEAALDGVEFKPLKMKIKAASQRRVS